MRESSLGEQMLGWLFLKKKMKFKDVFVSTTDRYAIGIEETGLKFYLSIPVSNGVVDYEEYYRIDKSAFERFQRDPALAIDFANRCRSRKMDHLLLVKPGRNRGVAS